MRLWGNKGKYVAAGQAIDDIMLSRKYAFACWIIKATDIRSKYVILFAFARCYIIPPLPVLLFSNSYNAARRIASQEV